MTDRAFARVTVVAGLSQAPGDGTDQERAWLEGHRRSGAVGHAQEPRSRRPPGPNGVNDGAGRRDVRMPVSERDRAAPRRHAVREDRLGSETQIGRRRPHESTRAGGERSGANAVDEHSDAHLFGSRKKASKGSEDHRNPRRRAPAARSPGADPRPVCLTRTDRSGEAERSRRERPGRFHTSLGRRWRRSETPEWTRRPSQESEGSRPEDPRDINAA